MKNIIFCLIMFLSFLVGYTKAADIDLEKIVVTPSRIEEEGVEYGGSVKILKGEDSEKKGLTSAKDALKEVGTLDIVQSGGFGKQTSVFMRGANSNHTLFMMDGVKFYDPMSPNAAPDIAHLTLDNLERIEIIEGAKSSLYGSDAIGGVINMITRKGRGKPSLSIINEGGSFYTHKHTIATQGELEHLGFSSSTSYFRTKGISAARAKDNNPEKDGYDNLSTVNRFDYKLSDSLTLGTVLRYTQSRSEYDDSGGAGGDDPNKQQFFRQSMGTVFADYSLARWDKQRLQVSWMDNFRRHRDDDNVSGVNDKERQWYDGTNYQINWQNTMELTDFETLIYGFDWNREKGDSYALYTWGVSDNPKRRTHARGYYLQNKLKLLEERAFFNTGLRIDEHSVFGSHTTFNQELILKPFKETKIWSSYGKGFKAPTLYQLYNPTYGNINLNPEKSSSYEMGMEQRLFNENLLMGLLFFNNHFKNLIDSDPNDLYKYANISKARAYGIEPYLEIKPIDGLKLTARYTWLDTENKDDQGELPRRAKNKAIFLADYKWQRIFLGLSISYIGHRTDSIYGYKLLKSYVLMNSSLSYDVNKNTNWFMRIENMLDDKYEEVKGYGTPGFSAYSGIKLSF